jgi:hypothetical protein
VPNGLPFPVSASSKVAALLVARAFCQPMKNFGTCCPPCVVGHAGATCT